jgi:hypothetical protein
MKNDDGLFYRALLLVSWEPNVLIAFLKSGLPFVLNVNEYDNCRVGCEFVG